MKIKTQQLIEKVRRTPYDNGSFEVQSKSKSQREILNGEHLFALIPLFPLSFNQGSCGNYKSHLCGNAGKVSHLQYGTGGPSASGSATDVTCLSTGKGSSLNFSNECLWLLHRETFL